MTKTKIPKNYWYGEGRKIIVIPPQIIRQHQTDGLFLNGLYLTEIGYYPEASNHYTHRKTGSSDNIMIYCLNGEGWVILNGEKKPVKPNTFFVLPQHIEHEYGASEDHPWTLYWVKFGGDGLSGLNHLSFTLQSFQPTPFAYGTEAIALFDEIFLSLEQGYSTQYLVYVNLLFVNFLTLFFFQHGSLIRKEHTNPHELIVQKVMEYMKKYLNKSISIAEFANTSGCSVSHLSNIFRLSTGHSPIDYFNQLKIQKACQELYSGNKLIKEIAAELGFSDQYYFSRLFRNIMGLSPNQYKNRNALRFPLKQNP
ncbi:AraC family transcriptional regulator [Pedobacter caeni]|uniref:Transcriptional regulator, AraC family n=1 Tax=Pedobacter caeni TaxID=288992 RepID=A0A1M5A826_9SPHI|nr:AraC family transcriptional regulator [Pedobacter caeni]SHF26438.1 transcriptional regulator, AraC family [Pedobacter caeni]